MRLWLLKLLPTYRGAVVVTSILALAVFSVKSGCQAFRLLKIGYYSKKSYGFCGKDWWNFCDKI